MGNLRATGVFIAVLSIMSLCSCSGGSSASNPGGSSSQGTANVFTIGTDAPLQGVVSCQLMITGVSLINSSGTQVPVLNAPATVDFAQLSGLHQLIDLSAVPTGTYTSAMVTLASPVISFIDTTQNPPAVSTINGTLAPATVTVTFPSQFVLTDSQMVGLRMELDLHQSLLTDGNGQITGTVDPMFNMQLLGADDSSVSIDDFMAGVVSTNGNSFIVQGPKGRQWTVQTSATTTLDDPAISISQFTTNTIVAVSGSLDPVSKDIDATEVEVVSMDGFYLAGLFTSIRPPTGPATAADLFVRAELPDINGIEDAQITTLTLTGNEQYRIANIKNPITTLIFNNSLLAPGQSVAVGGKLTTTNGVSTLTPHRVVLRRQGQQGTLVVGQTVIENGNQGSFELSDDWTDGILLPSPLPVLTTDATNFINLSGLSALTGTTALPLRVVGFVLIDPATNTPVMVARSVAQLPASN
jgi:Domain of unknown function (DUF4382)